MEHAERPTRDAPKNTDARRNSCRPRRVWKRFANATELCPLLILSFSFEFTLPESRLSSATPESGGWSAADRISDPLLLLEE